MITKRLALWILYVICRALKLVSWAIVLIYSTLPQFIKTCWSAHITYCSIFILCFLVTFKVRLFTQEELDAAVKKETEALRKQVTFAPLSVLCSCLAKKSTPRAQSMRCMVIFTWIYSESNLKWLLWVNHKESIQEGAKKRLVK